MLREGLRSAVPHRCLLCFSEITSVETVFHPRDGNGVRIPADLDSRRVPPAPRAPVTPWVRHLMHLAPCKHLDGSGVERGLRPAPEAGAA